MVSLSLTCIIALGFAMMQSSLAQLDSQQDFIDAHNSARAQVSVGPMTWDEEIAAFALQYANQHAGDCSMVHSRNPQYGENLAMSTGDLTGTAAVNMWVNEKANYDVKSNSCVGGECRHYTQVVWRDSVRLGCAKVRCTTGGTLVGCNYAPQGNIIGQRPF